VHKILSYIIRWKSFEFISNLLYSILFVLIERFGLCYFLRAQIIGLFVFSYLGFTLGLICAILSYVLIFAIRSPRHNSHDDDCRPLCTQNQLFQELIDPIFFHNLLDSTHMVGNCNLCNIVDSFWFYVKLIKAIVIYTIKYTKIYPILIKNLTNSNAIKIGIFLIINNITQTLKISMQFENHKRLLHSKFFITPLYLPKKIPMNFDFLY
jgi:hypothetical protein